MSIKVKNLLARLEAEAKKDIHAGVLGLLLDEAREVISNMQADLEALRNIGTDHG